MCHFVPAEGAWFDHNSKPNWYLLILFCHPRILYNVAGLSDKNKA